MHKPPSEIYAAGFGEPNFQRRVSVFLNGNDAVVESSNSVARLSGSWNVPLCMAACVRGKAEYNRTRTKVL
jgi:hypothetical protein